MSTPSITSTSLSEQLQALATIYSEAYCHIESTHGKPKTHYTAAILEHLLRLEALLLHSNGLGGSTPTMESQPSNVGQSSSLYYRLMIYLSHNKLCKLDLLEIMLYDPSEKVDMGEG
jgi:hypothetical protein